VIIIGFVILMIQGFSSSSSASTSRGWEHPGGARRSTSDAALDQTLGALMFVGMIVPLLRLRWPSA
jgi:hypothetical protein